MEYGIIRIMPQRAFLAPGAGIDSFAVYSDSPTAPSSGSDWPRIKKAIKRGQRYLIEFDSPAIKGEFHFSPDSPQAGRYEIQPKPRGRSETGKTVTVFPIEPKHLETYPYLTAIEKFPLRFGAVTAADEGQRTQKVWIVGIKHFETVEDELPDSES